MNVDAQGNVTGMIQTDATDTYNIIGTWKEAKNELNFIIFLFIYYLQ
jgi:hypothetical protein